MAREIDKRGVRTVGVITKIDIMDRGTNAKKMLMNQEVPLRLGYVGVKNRAQEDIINQIPVKDAIAKEQAFFQSHPVYSSMPPEMLGCFELTKKLSKILFIHIKHSLPEIIKEISDKKREAEQEVKDLGMPLPASAADKMHLLWNMITEFVQTYKNQIGGKYDARRAIKSAGGPQRQELSGGARIKMGFYKLYSDLDQMKATQEYSDMVIERAIAMHEGDSIPGFPSVDVFYYLIQPQLEKLREPALECLNDVYAQLEGLCA
jgi:vacuolar protein sorting-associated protein 1